MRNLAAAIVEVFLGLRFRLSLLVLLACAPLFALMLHTAWEDKRRAVAGWREKSRDLQEVAGRGEEDLIGTTRQLLLAVSESSYVRSFDPIRCRRGLDDLFSSYPRFANLGVLTTNGQVLASAKPVVPAGMAERSFFKKTLETKAFTIG